jgi:hypothetical protein
LATVDSAADFTPEHIGRTRLNSVTNQGNVFKKLPSELSSASLNWTRFAAQFVWHIFMPFLIPIHYCVAGKVAGINQVPPSSLFLSLPTLLS